MPTRPGPPPASIAALLARLGRLLLAADLLAGPLGDVLPLVGGVVLLRLAGARVGRRAAVVLAGLGDAVALLLVLGVLRARALRQPQRDQPRDRRVQQLRPLVHGSPRALGDQSLMRYRCDTSCRNLSCESKLRHMRHPSRWR